MRERRDYRVEKAAGAVVLRDEHESARLPDLRAISFGSGDVDVHPLDHRGAQSQRGGICAADEYRPCTRDRAIRTKLALEMLFQLQPANS